LNERDCLWVDLDKRKEEDNKAEDKNCEEYFEHDEKHLDDRISTRMRRFVHSVYLDYPSR
jgi:hypothetical protein